MCHRTTSVQFLEIKKQFLSTVSLQNFIWSDLFTFLRKDVGLQKSLLDMTIGDGEIKKYPVKISYQKLFLKYIINQLENESCDILDDIYSTYCDLVSKDKTSPIENTSQYKHYILPPGEPLKRVVLQESTNLLSSGTTGLSSWQAGVALAEWCLSHKSLFTGSCVLELGSGCGLTGLVTAVSSGASQVVLSDGHEAVMDQLSKNVSINSKDCILTLETTERVQASIANTKVSVQYLPWAQIPTCWKNEQAPDIILAADVVFDPELFPDLRDALLFLLALKPRESFAMLACTLRNEQTLQSFLQLLSSSNLSIVKVEDITESLFYYDKSSPIFIYQIRYDPKPQTL